MKRKLIFFLSTLILFAALSSPALASNGATPTPNNPVGTSRPHRQGRSKLDKKEITVFIDELIANKVITKETGDKLLAYFDQKREEHKAERQKISSMTEEQRKAYFEERKAKRDAEGPFAELVKNKTLTQAQADAIAKAMREYRKNKSS